MAPSSGKHGSNSDQTSTTKISTEISVSWSNVNIQQNKENQRPPVYNAEDYTLSLKKYARRPNNNQKSIYDNSDNDKPQEITASTLPGKRSEYKNPIAPPSDMDSEMTLRQFGSITDLLTKLRADLRAAFPSFVQEFITSPLDGVSLLLEVLRAIQLSQTTNHVGTLPLPNQEVPKNSQCYQRRALLDELACLQCLSLCCTRCPEASFRLGSSPAGLLPLAVAATGQGLRSRIIALQLLTTACDKSSLIHHGSQKLIANGHTAVSEALSTLRLRCGEPVRFRLLIGMLNSSGGSGEFQAVGLKFINSLLESADSLQNRLYLQAELIQAGLEPDSMLRTVSSSSSWVDKLHNEIKKFADLRIDIEKLVDDAREAEKIRNRMVILDRRVQILQEEKTVLTSMERRLQERCAELQREIFRLQGNQCVSSKDSNSRPLVLPRQVPPHKNGSSEQEDEGISSSEAGQSMSPEPILVLPQMKSGKYLSSIEINSKNDDEREDTIDEVIEELQNIVNDAEREIAVQRYSCLIQTDVKEQEIIPVKLLPQPPKKARSLAHILSSESDYEGSEYGIHMGQTEYNDTFFDDIENEKRFFGDTDDMNSHSHLTPSSMNREILNVIMDAREKDEQMNCLIPPVDDKSKHAAPLQKFNGVFFMGGMNKSPKYPRPDVAAALEARRVSKSLDRFEAGYGLDSMIDIVLSPDNRNGNIINKDKLSSSSRNTSMASPPVKISKGNIALFSTNGSRLVRNDSIVHNHSITGSRLTDIPSGLY